MIEWFGNHLEKNDETQVALCTLPLYHIYGFTINFVTLMSLGYQNILIPL